MKFRKFIFFGLLIMSALSYAMNSKDIVDLVYKGHNIFLNHLYTTVLPIPLVHMAASGLGNASTGTLINTACCIHAGCHYLQQRFGGGETHSNQLLTLFTLRLGTLAIVERHRIWPFLKSKFTQQSALSEKDKTAQ